MAESQCESFHVPKSLCHVIFVNDELSSHSYLDAVYMYINPARHRFPNILFYDKLLYFVVILKRVCNLKESADSSETPVTTIRLHGVVPKNPLSP
jgi:hypothetical protein